jgi:glycerate kinase
VPSAPVLEDVLPSGARVLFCGTAAGTVSAAVGAPYAGPGNAFWPTLHAVGLLPWPLDATAFRDAARFGIALTDLDKERSGSDAEIGTSGFDPAAVAVKARACGARIVAFTSKTAGTAALGTRTREPRATERSDRPRAHDAGTEDRAVGPVAAGPRSYGPQPERLAGAEVWILPSPSGRARRYWDAGPWAALARRAAELAPVVLCAPDKLRGAADAEGAAEALAAGVRDAGGWPVTLPVADGGEGTLEAFVAGGHARPVAVRSRNAHGRRTDARIAVLRRVGAGTAGAAGDGVPAGVEDPAGAEDPEGVVDPGGDRVAASGHDTAIEDAAGGEGSGPTVLVEAAEAIALAAIPEDERRVGRASSAGVGDLLLAALDLDPGRILVTVGGSASVDGGAGFLRALGVDAPADGDALLAAPTAVDPTLPGLDPRLRGVALELLHDVDAPLCGPDGAARRFGPQKGATADEVDAYDAALARWAAALEVDPDLPGSGAAGGLGLALRAIGATARPGADAVLDLVGFDALAAHADLVLTAEGSVDASTLQGKTVDAVVRHSRGAGTPVVVVGGRVEDGAASALRERGARSVEALGPEDRPLAEALAAAPAELRAAARRAVGVTQRPS